VETLPATRPHPSDVGEALDRNSRLLLPYDGTLLDGIDRHQDAAGGPPAHCIFGSVSLAFVLDVIGLATNTSQGNLRSQCPRTYDARTRHLDSASWESLCPSCPRPQTLLRRPPHDNSALGP
jgi:hypothetical protein